MELRQLEVFERVAVRKGITRAAEELFLTQPAVSRSLATLERELGTPLFDRFARSIELTPAGRALLEHAQRLLRGAAEAIRAVADVREGVGGTLSVGASSSAATYVLPGILSEYRSRFPEVELSIQTGGSAHVAGLVTAAAVDIGVVMGIAPRPELEEIPLREFETVLAVARDHPLASTGAATVAQIASEPLITMQPGTNLRRFVDELYQTGGHSSNITMELDNVEAIKHMVEAGLGVSLLPLLAIEWEMEHGRLFAVRIRGTSIPLRRMSVIRRKDRFLSSAAKQLIDVLHLMWPNRAGASP